MAEYVVFLNARDAYRAAFPTCSHSTVEAASWSIMQRPHVKAEIDAINRDYESRLRATADGIMEELVAVSRSDVAHLTNPDHTFRNPRELPLHVRRAVSRVKFEEKVVKEFTKGKGKKAKHYKVIQRKGEYCFWNKIDANKMLAANLGLKMELPPLDLLLAMLPAPLAAAMREQIAAQNDKVPVPSQNGYTGARV